jgi:hypothetical protein
LSLVLCRSERLGSIGKRKVDAFFGQSLRWGEGDLFSGLFAAKIFLRERGPIVGWARLITGDQNGAVRVAPADLPGRVE